MNNNKSHIFFLTLLFSIQSYATSAVTYNLTWGRFGDHLISYSTALWVSHIHNIPLLYRPFHYADQLVMHTAHSWYDKEKVPTQFKSVILLENKNIPIDPDAHILYVVPFFEQSIFEAHHNGFFIDWSNSEFIKKLRSLIKPKHALWTPEIPADHISVAVHVRRGGGYDDPSLMLRCAHKAPPDSYYIEQIQKIAAMFADQKLFVFIFTDHHKPQEIVEKYETAVDKKNVTFACREHNNSHDANIVEDFFCAHKI